MVKMATFIVDKRNLFFLITIIGLIFSAFSRNWVEVENDLSFYLPDDAETKLALDVMEEQFTTYGTAEVMVANVTYGEALELNDRITEVKGVQSVAFDETTDHYARSSALFTVTFAYDETDDACLDALDAVKELLADYDLYISTDLGDTLAETIDSEVSVIMVYVAVIVVVVLTLTSRTFGEVPVLLLTFVTAMILNQGTNFLLGRISFVSNSVTSVLQLALLSYLQTAMDSFYSSAAHLSAAMGHLYDALGTLRTLNGQAEDIFAQLDAVLRAAQQAADAMARAMSQAAQWARDLSGEDVDGFSPLGPEFSESSDALNTSLGGISNELSALNGEITSANTVLLSDVRAVNDQLMKVMNLFLNILNDTQNVDYTDVFEDVSEESLQSAARGKVLECTNRGAVTADRNAGGIAGAMAIEYDTDPEDDLLTSRNRSARFTYQTKAIPLDCDNYGAVQAKKSCAGGIAGCMDLGTISGCGGWGAVASESGDYAGGVAGLSLSSIRGSYAKCTLSGGRYVGGITGSGSRVSDCISMVDITACTQLGGAIAGEITGAYSGNRFVSDTLAGVDRVSYAGRAEQIGYHELCAIENIPEDFLHLTLRFAAEDTVLREQEFDYGASFTEASYPEIPSKDGCYGLWDTNGLTELHFDTVVTAVYEPYVTTLASDTRRGGHAAVLAEGLFRDGDRLRGEERTDLSAAPDNAVAVWAVQLPDDGQTSHTIRWLLPAGSEGAYEVCILREDGWEKVDSQQIGSYLCFEMTGDGQFAVIPARHAPWWIWALAVAASAGAAGGILLLARKHRKREA